jgi:hypothetical protein
VTVSQHPPVGADQGITLRTGHFVLDWTLRLTHTDITIDGHKHERPWGEHFFSLEPGRHQLEVSYPYLRRPRGKASMSFDVAPNQVVEARYKTPTTVLVANHAGTLSFGSGQESQADPKRHTQSK